MKYYYQFSVESEVGQHLAEFHRRCIKAEEMAEHWAKKMGASHYFDDPNYFAGGVTAVQFDVSPTNKRWRKAGTATDGQPYYVLDIPAKKDNLSVRQQSIVRLEEERCALPKITAESLYHLLGADMEGPDLSASGKPFRLPSTTPVFFQYGDQWYIGLDLPVNQEGFLPLTSSAFNFRKSQLLEAARNSA